jgi:hypothetical protein
MLNRVADALIVHQDEILSENAKDVQEAEVRPPGLTCPQVKCTAFSTPPKPQSKERDAANQFTINSSSACISSLHVIKKLTGFSSL